MRSPFPGTCHGWLIALGGCQPEPIDTAGLTTLLLPHPTSLPKVTMGAKGLQQTHDFFAGGAQNCLPASKLFFWGGMLLWPGVPPIKDMNAILRKMH